MEKPVNHTEWAKLVLLGGGGPLGAVAIVLTLIGTLIFAYFGVDLFDEGSYPRIVLAIPGLLMGLVFFVVVTMILWPFEKMRHRS